MIARVVLSRYSERMTTSAHSARLLERLSRLIHNEAHAHGLKPVQWDVLRYLNVANRYSRSPSAVTSYLNLTKGTVSQTLNALEAKGLVVKRADATDRRRVTLDLSSQARTALKDDPLLRISSHLDALQDDNRRGLDAGLRELLDALIRERKGRPFGVCHTCRHHRPGRDEGQGGFCNLLGETLSIADGDLLCVEHAA
ncbi:MarR family transcriptional regulator [Maricaulis maris]|uniref:MarR family transcriptional regulator n=2 Tax=Maricaulis maris TaxID=74318 RepID=A0A495DML3_9PROT|nr:MarR family transcriptional regulator [Maricaulis maris]